MNTPVFCTGSQVYGTPHAGSDLDLVVYAPDEDTQHRLRMFETGAGSTRNLMRAPPYTNDGSFSVRFDRLNVQVCTSEAAYKAWKKGTEALVEETIQDVDGDDGYATVKFCPVTRERAVEVFDACRAAYGLTPAPDGELAPSAEPEDAW